MRPPARLLLVLLVVAASMSLSLVRRDNTARMMAASYTGVLVIDGPVRLEINVTPPVGAPRDTLQLTAKITNYNESFASPQVELNLPTTLGLGSNQLPTGVTANVANNSLQWLPVVPPAGGVRELSLQLKVNSADLARPEQTVGVQYRTAESSESDSITLWIGIPPRVVKLDSSGHVAVGQPLQLSAQVQGPGPFSESWNLGDGRTVLVNSPSIVYPLAGVYDVTLSVKNPVGEATYATQITVVPHVSAAFEPQDDTPGQGQTIVFNNLGGGKQPVSYFWDFGDGMTSTEIQPAHSYDRPGTYNVRLIAQNEFGVAESMHEVTVGLPPLADMAVAESAPAGSQLSGEVIMAGLDSSSTSYTWEMGDGRRYDQAKIRHVYRQQGDYYVTLTASNEFGETKVGRWVHVEQGTLSTFLPMVSNLSVSQQGSSVDSIPELENISAADIVLDDTFVMDPIDFSAATPPIQRLLAYVNEARRQFDLSELTVAENLSLAAQKHTDDMAAAPHNQHTGSDGSIPAERFLQFSYGGGYAGEATAWGFADPRQAVEFWVNSPGHRPIILNRWASEVGLGYTVDYTAPSVWYWTAEFGNSSATPEAPVLRAQAPQTGLEMLNSETVFLTWNWPAPLSSAEQFTVYLQGPSGTLPVANVLEPHLGTQYRAEFKPLESDVPAGEYQWLVKLENNRGAELASSELRTIAISIDPDLPTATPVPTLGPTAAAATVTPTVTPTATATTIAPTPRPTDTPAPVLVTATPAP